jgi:hypothetical protein
MAHNFKTPSPDGERWKVFPHISRHPLAADFESPEDLVIVGYLSHSQYRKLKPHRTMSDDSEREKAFANGLRSKVMKPSEKKKKSDNGGTVAGVNGAGVNRSVGPCAAMGRMCGNPNLENNRHGCCVCGRQMHIIAPCCQRFDLENDVQVCGMCEYHGEKEVLHFSEDDDDEAVVVKKVGPVMSRDMLASSEDEEEESEDEEAEAFKTPRAKAKAAQAAVKKKAVASVAMPPLGVAAAAPPAAAAAAGKKSRSPNFSSVEDTFITRAWCSATEDSRKGSGQKQQDFNKTLYARFVSLADEYNEQTRRQFQINMKYRTHKAIVERFAKIKRATSHFAGVVSRNKIKSGETHEIHMQRCSLVYEQTHKSKFIWLECYEILEELPKWNAQNEPSTQGDSAKPAAKRKHRGRSTGKRQKALSDKIEQMLEKHNKGASNSDGSGDRLSAVGGTLNQMTSHMVEQLNFTHWSDDDKARYFTQDALEKSLQQRKRILMLEKELAVLEACKDPTLDNGEGDEEDSLVDC